MSFALLTITVEIQFMLLIITYVIKEEFKANSLFGRELLGRLGGRLKYFVLGDNDMNHNCCGIGLLNQIETVTDVLSCKHLLVYIETE